MKHILVTGAAGFIGFHLSKYLLDQGYFVIGLDNINDYYDINLKYARLQELGIERIDASEFNQVSSSNSFENFKFIRLNLEDRENLPDLFGKYNFEIVCNLAAQAGVRYSLENPESYIDSNVVGFLNLLECCRHHDIKHLIYASSSSVYGQNEKIPFSTDDNVDYPISLYAATKKSNELMAYTYSHLYGFKTTGLRFFTVYGPWGRPDMAISLFTNAIWNNKPIQVFNEGKLSRDFTFIDDIIDGISAIIEHYKMGEEKGYKLYNIGNGNPVKLLNFIKALEKSIGKKAQKNMTAMQPGDVEKTWADIADLKKLGYSPKTDIISGVQKYISWFRDYYQNYSTKEMKDLV